MVRARHLSAGYQDRVGISMTMIQENLRHSSINTTKIYVHADDVAKSDAMEKIALDIPRSNAESTTQDLYLNLNLSGANVRTGVALE